jgi:hypothetical protein
MMWRLQEWDTKRDMNSSQGRLFGRISCHWCSFGRRYRQSSIFVVLETLELTLVIPPRRRVGTQLSVVVTWVWLALSGVELHALRVLCTCQLDLVQVNEFRSIERFMGQNTGPCTTHNTWNHHPDPTLNQQGNTDPFEWASVLPEA